MDSLKALLDSITALSSTDSSTVEESYRLTIEGSCLSEAQASIINDILGSIESLLPDCLPTLLINEVTFDFEDPIHSKSVLSSSWRLIIAKKHFSAKLNLTEKKNTLFFFSENGLCQWLEQLNPFIKSSVFDPDFDEPLSIFVNGLTAPLGGPSLSILPLNNEPLEEAPTFHSLPNSTAVHSLVHCGSDLKISPRDWSLTWGKLDTPVAQPILRLGCLALGACLVNDLKYSNNVITATIRGVKQYTLPLWNANSSLPWAKLHPRLIKAVSWVYSEHPETRLKLLMDRLTLDLHSGECLLACLFRHLDDALKQADDSYGFVIRDRKDAYYKEVRELMKDMKAQADYYATKTRDMVNALSRDFLGVLVFLAFSFFGRLSPTNFSAIISSVELELFLRFLSVYLLLSFFLQFLALIRDDQLTNLETRRWLDALCHYTSSTEKSTSFLRPIESRRNTLYIALIVSAIFYGLLIGILWELPTIIQLILRPSS